MENVARPQSVSYDSLSIFSSSTYLVLEYIFLPIVEFFITTIVD